MAAQAESIMQDTTSPDKPARGLRVDDEHLMKMLDRLDEHEPDARSASRDDKRFPYRDKACIATIAQPGGSAPLAFVVTTRNLSAGGLSFLHGGFVHSGAICKLRLVNRFGSWADVEATVGRCRYVDSMVHEVSVTFKSPINPGDFCPEATTQRVLLAEDSLAMVRIAKHYLESFNTEVVHVENGQEAVKLVSEQDFDLILMDMDMPVMDGFEAVEKLREKGCAIPIIAVTGLTSEDSRERCLKLGCDAYLKKPYRREDLARSMTIVRQEPLVSALGDDPAVLDLIASYLDELPGNIRAIEQAFAKADDEALAGAARGFRSEGGAHGFEPIATTALKIEEALRRELPRKVIQARPLPGSCWRSPASDR